MNKKEFESSFLEHLDILIEDEKQKELRFYINKIEEQERLGMSEEEAVKSLGDIESIISQVLSKRGIDFSKVYKKHGFIYSKFEQFFQVIRRLVDAMSKNDFKSNLKIIFDLLILFAFIAILKIPFIVVQNLGDTILGYFSIPVLADIWSLLIDLVYIVVAFIVFMHIFQKYFKNIKVEKKNALKTKGLESISLSDQEKE